MKDIFWLDNSFSKILEMIEKRSHRAVGFFETFTSFSKEWLAYFSINGKLSLLMHT